MAGITINRLGGGLGRQQPGEDYISGLIFKQAALPSGFETDDRIKKVTTLAEAESLGIDNSHSDETKATGGNVAITASGATGDVWTIKITPVGASEITLGTYTEQSGDTTALIATGLYNNVNLNTINHGFTATNSVASEVALIAPAKLGASINASGLVSDSTGSGTSTDTQFTGGVGSVIAIIYYHVSEFFALAEQITGLAQGILYIGIYTAYDGSQLKLLQDYAEGKIRQIGVFLPDTFASSMVTGSQTTCTTLETENQPLSVLITADFTATTLSALADMRALNSKNVTVVIGEDKGCNGCALTGITGISISCLGAAMGTLANASVHENLGWRQKFNQIHDSEYEGLQFVTGEDYKIQSQTTLTQLTNKGYIYLTKEINVNGSYYNDAPTSTLITSDYAFVENNRTIDKAARLVRENLVPKINSPLYVNPTTGKLSLACFIRIK